MYCIFFFSYTNHKFSTWEHIIYLGFWRFWNIFKGFQFRTGCLSVILYTTCIYTRVIHMLFNWTLHLIKYLFFVCFVSEIKQLINRKSSLTPVEITDASQDFPLESVRVDLSSRPIGNGSQPRVHEIGKLISNGCKSSYICVGAWTGPKTSIFETVTWCDCLSSDNTRVISE